GWGGLCFPAITPPGTLVSFALVFFLFSLLASHLTAQIADQSDREREELTRCLGQRKGKTSRSHFTHDLTTPVIFQRKKASDMGERVDPCILIRSQHGDDSITSLSQIFEKVCSHSFPIYNKACLFDHSPTGLIASENGRRTRGQVLIASACCRKKWVAM